MRTVLVLLISLCAARDGNAHEFWLQPSDYWLKPRSILAVTLQVGDGGSRQRSSIPLHRITRFEAMGSGAPIDLRAGLSATGKGNITLGMPGIYVLALETDNRAYSRQSAARFNEYLATQGLTPALEYRARTHQMHADGFERYSRSAKSLVMLGPPGLQAHAHVTRPLGLPVEIIPEVSPYFEPRPANLPVQVLYKGHPLSGARVKLMNLAQLLAPAEARLTDRAGRATFTMPKNGDWLLSVVWTQRLANSSDADFETSFASLTFGFREQVFPRR